jgi:hypothetical protein
VAEAGPGAIALAAYEPDSDLFTAQLRSIQSQSVRDFLCIIGADSDPERVSELARVATGGDSRFVVVGDGTRLGFYLNFERALDAVPREAGWVALSDQDDLWYPDKLQRLLPRLADVALVTCQSRVVSHPHGNVVLGRTRRRRTSFDDLLVHNQVTGAHSVFRRSLLDVALPFPRVNAVTELHDHWLAVCAAAHGGWDVVDDVLQDYVQHGENLIGEVGPQSMDPRAVALRIRELADRYEGGHSLPAMSRVCNRLSFGWRRAMLTSLVSRSGGIPEVAEEAWRAFRSDHGNLAMMSFLRNRFRSDEVATGTVATFLPGVPAELVRRWRLET